METKKFIKVCIRKTGWHDWPHYKDDELTELFSQEEAGYSEEFLGQKHRHMFHFWIMLEVKDIEEINYLQFKRWMINIYKYASLSINDRSVEQLADELRSAILAKYPGRELRMEILEDLENGCYIEYKC